MTDFAALNGNGHANGNGKAFSLSPPKTPEDMRREQIRRAMPGIRRSVSQMWIIPSAKWLFCQISDDTFMNSLGGDTFGTLCTTIKDLAASYHHSRETISEALASLKDADVIWTESDRGFLLIHISAIVPPPSHRSSLVARAKARQSAAKIRVEKPDTDVSRAQRGVESREIEEIRTPCRDSGDAVTGFPARRDGFSGTPCQETLHGMHEKPDTDAKTPATPCPETLHGVTDSSSWGAEKTDTGASKASMVAGEKAPLERSPNVESGSQEISIKRSTEGGLNASKKGKGKKTAENVFLLDVGAMMERWRKGSSKSELANSGAWWRLEYRKDHALMRRVLAETERAVKEGQIKTSPGQYAVDLHGRWK